MKKKQFFQAKAETRREKRINKRKEKIEKIEGDLKDAKGVVQKCVVGALAKREKLLNGLDCKFFEKKTLNPISALIHTKN